jgi:hypothetical protein
MSVLIAYKYNPKENPRDLVMEEPIHLVLAKDMAEARFICEGDLKGCYTNIFEGKEVKKWLDQEFPWDKITDSTMTLHDLKERYHDDRGLALTYLQGKMSREEEYCVERKCNMVKLLIYASEYFARESERFLDKLRNFGQGMNVK